MQQDQPQKPEIVNGRQVQSQYARWKVFVVVRNHRGHEREMTCWSFAPTAEEACTGAAEQLREEGNMADWRFFEIVGCKYEPKRN